LKHFTLGNQTQSKKKAFLLTRLIYPKIGEKLIEAGRNFTDASGNMFIDQNGVYLMRLGAKEKEMEKTETKGWLFRESGLKLLFGILHNPEFIT